MARDPEVQRLRKEIEALLAFNKESLTSRTKWGEISFEAAQRDYERIFSVLTYLKVLPLEYLTDTVVGSITNEITSVRSLFDQVDKFNIQVPDPSGTRNNLVTQIHNRADGLYNVASPWVPFLAYQKGDVAENINKLTKAVNDAKAILDGAGADITAKKKDIDGIIAKAREASGKAGAAVFTEDFQKESEANSNRAKRWLHATWIIALVTI
ncbi:MAG TPA: hypothetical protein VJN65_01720, partial [Bacteroidota bacterium]|nr:hypothetical protein [Bacteroidota bacterium]